MGQLRREAGSFRDPSGYVLSSPHGIYRSLDADSYELVQSFLQSSAYADLATTGSVIRTETIDDATRDDLRREEAVHDRFYVIHQKLSFVNYPYEWTGRMLLDAALCTLETQSTLIDAGYNLKDASAYNVQFDFGTNGPTPVFIDIGSIEPTPDTGGIWLAYKQFLSHFLLPLLYYRRFGQDFKSTFLSDIEGLDPEQAYRLTGPIKRWFPPYLTLVTLPHWLRGWETSRTPAHSNNSRKKSDLHREKALFIARHTVNSLKRKINRLGGVAGGSHWVDYEENNIYSPEAMEEKEAFVKRVVDRVGPATVLDIGCNIGKFSLMAAGSGSRVIALDTDTASLDRLYATAREKGATVLPLRVDITNPSPGIGWRNRERASFLDRAGEFDCVLALAVMHHMTITKGIPTAEIAELLHQLTGRNLVLELIGPSDPMFQRLLRGRDTLYSGQSLEVQEQAFAEFFTILETHQLPGMERRLYLLEKREK